MHYIEKMAWLAFALASFAEPVAASDDLMSSQMVDQAHHWQQKNRDDMAAEIWRKLLRVEPGHPEALVRLGVIEARAGNVREAEALYIRATQVAAPPAGLKELSAALLTAKGPLKDLASAPVVQAHRKPAEAVAKPKQDKHPANVQPIPADIKPHQTTSVKPAKAASASSQGRIGTVASDDPKLIFSTSIDLAPLKPRP